MLEPLRFGGAALFVSLDTSPRRVVQTATVVSVEKKTAIVKVRLEPSLHERLSALAERDHRTVGGLVRLAVHEYLAARENNKKEEAE